MHTPKLLYPVESTSKEVDVREKQK